MKEVHGSIARVVQTGPVLSAEAEPALAVLHGEPDLGRNSDQGQEHRIGEEIPDLRLVGPLNHERLIELGVADLDVLDPKELPQSAEESVAIDREAECVRVHVRGMDPGGGDGVLSAYGCC